MDGNFIHAVMSMKLGDAKDVVVKYLGAPSKLFTTRCVKEELRLMGKDLKEASFYARKLEEVKDGPDPPAPALDSIVAAVDGGNSERFIVCTQDDKLRKRLLADSPMTPVVFCHTSGLQMEPPADAEGSGVASQRNTARVSRRRNETRWVRRRWCGVREGFGRTCDTRSRRRGGPTRSA